jgi:hypothetical protein
MGYRLKGSNSFSHEIKGIVTEQIDNALDCLKRSGNKDEGIHEARVCVKKIRALLRLVQDSLGSDSYASEDKVDFDSDRLPLFISANPVNRHHLTGGTAPAAAAQ